MIFAPGHQPLPGNAEIGAEDDPHLRPRPAKVADDPVDLLDRAGRCIDVRSPQLCSKQVPATEDVQRQVAAAIVVAVEEAAFLMAVQRIVGGIQVEDDLQWRRGMGLEEQIEEQPLDRAAVVADPW